MRVLLKVRETNIDVQPEVGDESVEFIISVNDVLQLDKLVCLLAVTLSRVHFELWKMQELSMCFAQIHDCFEQNLL
jgi:hypothetical protein